MQDTDNIANPTPVERHVDDLLLHRGQAAGIGIAADEGSATLDPLLTAKPLLAIARLPILHDRFTLTMWTLYRCLCQQLSLLVAHHNRLCLHQQMGDMTHSCAASYFGVPRSANQSTRTT